MKIARMVSITSMFLCLVVSMLQPATLGAAKSEHNNLLQHNTARLQQQANCPATVPVGMLFTCAITTAGQVNSVKVQVKQNDQWFFRAHRTAGALQIYIVLLDDNGNNVCSTYTYSTDVRMDCSITTSGTYTLKIRDVDSNSTNTGNYQVYGQRLNGPAASTALNYGTQTNATIQYPIESDVYRISASINDKLLIRVRRTSGSMTPWMYVYDSSGNQLCGNYSYGAVVHLDCTADKTDTFYIFIRDLSLDATGNYTLHLQRKNNPGNPTPISYGIPINAALSVGSEMDVYTFTANANDHTFVHVQQTSGSMRPSVYIYDPSGIKICSDYSYGRFISVNCDITEAGTYTILVQDTDAELIGEYTIHLQRTNSPGNVTAIDFGQTLGGAIESLGAFDSYVFIPKPNDSISLSFKRNTGAMTFWVGVYNAAGERICSNYSYGGELSLKKCAITTEGQHAILVFANGNEAVGTYSMTLACETGMCGYPPPQTTKLVYIPHIRR